MKVIIFTDCCSLEEIMDDYAFEMYDKALDNYNDPIAISFFEKNYPEYCDIIEIPQEATDVEVIDTDDFTRISVVINGKIKCIYYNNFM